MKALTLKDQDARRLITFLAGIWAHRSTHLLGADARIDNPVQAAAHSESLMAIAQVQRAWEIERDWAARIMTGLDVQLPAITPEDTGRIVYAHPARRLIGNNGVAAHPLAFNRQEAQALAKRLKAAIVDAAKGESK